MTPGRRWWIDCAGEIEVYPEMAFRPVQDVGEALPREDLHAPDVGHRRAESIGFEELFREIISGEVQGGFGAWGSLGAWSAGIAAIEADGVFATVLVPVVVLESEALIRACQHPGARAVLADVEGDLETFLFAPPYVHRHGLLDKGVVGWILGGETSGEGPTAQGTDAIPPDVRGRSLEDFRLGSR